MRTQAGWAGRARHLWIVLILGLGIAFRFAFPHIVRQSYDNSYPIYDAVRMLDGHELLSVGQPSSVFVDNPPLMAYLQALPLLLWRSPWAVTLFLTSLNTLGILFVHLGARRLVGETAALLAAFLFAVNPWLAYYSRTSWVQALLPFFTALIAWGLWPILALPKTSERRPARERRMLAAMVGVTALVQTYVAAYGILAQVAPLIAAFWRRIPRRAFFAGLAVLVVASSLYVVGLARGGGANSLADLRTFASDGSLHLTREGVDHAIRLVTGRDFEWVYTQSVPRFESRRNVALVVHYLLLVALIAGVLRALWELTHRRGKRAIAAILLTWFLVPILLMSVSRFPVHPHYQLLSCPAGHVLAGWAIAPLLRGRGLRLAVLSVAVAIAGFFGVVLYRADQQVVAQPTAPGFDRWSIAAASRVGAAARDLTSDQGYPRVICGEWSPVILSAASATWFDTIGDLDYPNFVLLPGDSPLIYMLDDRPPTAGALGPLEEPLPQYNLYFAGGAAVSFLRVGAYSRSAALGLPAVRLDWPSEVGLSLLGYSCPARVQPGTELDFTTYWRVDDLLPARGEWYVAPFYHLVDENQSMLANVSGHGRWAYLWRQGDVYIERAQITVPASAKPGAYSVEFGLFDRLQTNSYSLRPAGGAPYATVSIQVGE